MNDNRLKSSSTTSLNLYLAEFKPTSANENNDSFSQHDQEISQVTISELSSNVHARIKYLEDELKNAQADKEYNFMSGIFGFIFDEK